MRWLILLMSLPPTPTRHRVGVWRKLKRMGAVNLRGSAWILPENSETTELFHWLGQEGQAFGGGADRPPGAGDERRRGEAGVPPPTPPPPPERPPPTPHPPHS